jgi:hypothetical protein
MLISDQKMFLGNFMKIPSTIVGRGFSFQEAGQALSEITTSLLPSLMVRLESNHCSNFFVSSCLNHHNTNFMPLFMQSLLDVLPKESIVWKLKMLRTASSFVNSRLHAVKAQTLVLARYV